MVKRLEKQQILLGYIPKRGKPSPEHRLHLQPVKDEEFNQDRQRKEGNRFAQKHIDHFHQNVHKC